ncbi:MAG: tRNA (N6-isopentenyl adenosine(37)-C2)-methylthiotransferase MiaB [Alphaproteobacteria bacterium]
MISRKKFYIKTYGCQMNFYDSGRIADLLRFADYEETKTVETADLVILNTCHIREKAKQKVLSELGRIKRRVPEKSIIAVGGCVAQAEGEEIVKQAPFVNIVFGPQSYHKLPKILANFEMGNFKKKIIETEFPVETKFRSLTPHQTFSACVFLTVQEGCNRFCTFCVVPYTRGAEFSRPVDEVVAEARQLVRLGAKEIILLGQNVNAYHGRSPSVSLYGKKEWGLGRLIMELSSLYGLERIRYTTSHPCDMDDDLLKAHHDVPKLMPFLHLPIQSGSDQILKRMNRQHTVKQYYNVIDRLFDIRSDMAISSDFIVGFPGETDKDFKETLALIESIPYSQAYSFIYSPRPGTPAAMFNSHIDQTKKKERLEELQKLVNKKQLSFNRSKIGTIQQVLLNRYDEKKHQIIGKTPYMQSVPIIENSHFFGEIVPVQIKEAFSNSLSGVILQKEKSPSFKKKHAQA